MIDRIRRTSLLMAAAGLLAACGDSSMPSDKTAPFVGVWTVARGLQVAMCPPLQPLEFDLTGLSQTMVKGSDADLEMTLQIDKMSGSTCRLKLDVTGSEARIRPGQMCTFTVMLPGSTNPIMVTGTLMSGNFTVSGTTATFSYAGTAAFGPASCTFSAMGTSGRGAPDGGAPASADAASGS